MKAPFLILLITGCLQVAVAQTDSAWKGRQCAVVLTYDDAIDQQLDNAVPVLDSLQLKATFYITAFSPSMQHRMQEWKQLATKGYELGNHTLFHPCMGGSGREWVAKEYDLNSYSVKRMEDEINATNLFLQALDGQQQRTFAFTCGDMKVGDSLFMNGLRNKFLAARAVRNEMHPIQSVDLYNVDCYLVNNYNAATLLQWVDQAIKTHSLLVILFHGVGGGNGLNISTEEHRKFCIELKRRQQSIWIAPMAEVATHIQQWQSNHPAKSTIDK